MIHRKLPLPKPRLLICISPLSIHLKAPALPGAALHSSTYDTPLPSAWMPVYECGLNDQKRVLASPKACNFLTRNKN
jgi:hypothetical protein